MNLHGLGALALLATLDPSGRQVTEELVLRNESVSLAATLALPAGEGPFPAALLLAGSGPSTRADLSRFAAHLGTLGVATLSWDKRGCGGSSGSWTRASLDDAVADARAGFTALRADPRIDPDRIGAWGVSQAGWFLPVLAERTPELAFAIVLTGGGSTPREVELFMHRLALERSGVSAAERAEAEALLGQYFAWLGSGDGHAELVAALARARATRWYAAVSLDRVMPAPEDRPKWEWVARFDPLPAIERMKLPTLVVLGGADELGSPTAARERWQEGLARAENPRARVVVVEGMGHAASLGAHHHPGGPLAEGYQAEVAAFLGALR